MAHNSQRTERVYLFIRGYIHEHSYAPSLREISHACNLSGPSVDTCLMWLEAQGRLRRRAKTARSIVLLDGDSDDP